MKTQEDIYYSIKNLNEKLTTSQEIDDVVIEGLLLLNQLRAFYKTNKNLFNSDLIFQIQNLKKSIEAVDCCLELIYDDYSTYNCKELEKIKKQIPQNKALLSLIEQKINSDGSF